ncbi:hypothetical protein [Chryseobacterium sp. M5A1_1a]
MENITEKIKSALLYDGNWKFSDFYLNVELLKNNDIQVSFWEDEEYWATLLSNNKVIGYIWKKYPLLIIEKNYQNAISLNTNQCPFLCTIIVENLDNKILKLDYNILKNQLSDWEIDYNKFSANDLWFNTNSI